MNRSRYVATLLAAGALMLAGCASGGGSGGGFGGGTGGGVGGGAGGGEGLRENEYTRSAELFLTQAESIGAVERFADALSAAMSSIAEDPTNPLGYFQAGRAQVGLGDYVAADTLLGKALEMHPAYEADVALVRESAWIAAYNAHLTPLDSGLLEVAIDRLEDAELIFGGMRPEALINLGATYSQMNRAEDAIDAFAGALEVIRGPRVQAMLQTEDSAQARGWLERETVLTFNRAQLLMNAERFAEAAAAFEAYLQSYPDDIQARSSMAATLTAAGMIDSAQAVYDDLLEGEDLGARDYFNIGVGLYQADDYTNAAVAFGNVVAVSPQNREALLYQANSMLLAEDYEGCIPVAMALVDLDGYNRESHSTLGRCLARAENQQDAIEHLCRGRDPMTEVSGCESIEPLAFSINNPRLEPSPRGGGSVVAEFTNASLEAGTQVTIRVHFNGADGSNVGTRSLRVEAPAPGESTVFQADLESDQEVVGYYFQVIPPR